MCVLGELDKMKLMPNSTPIVDMSTFDFIQGYQLFLMFFLPKFDLQIIFSMFFPEKFDLSVIFPFFNISKLPKNEVESPKNHQK